MNVSTGAVWRIYAHRHGFPVVATLHRCIAVGGSGGSESFSPVHYGGGRGVGAVFSLEAESGLCLFLADDTSVTGGLIPV